ncbi:MAG: amidohydrolase family protein [Nitrospinota bacterium]
MPEGRTVDIHCHFVTPECLERMSEVDPAWKFSREEGGPESYYVRINDRRVGPMRLGGFDPERRLRDMDEAGVDLHVLSPVPYLFLYEAEPKIGERLAQIQNDCLAQAVQAHPDRFAALATAPLQDAALAVRVLDGAMNDLGMKGAEIGTHVCGKNLDHPDLFPFFERAAELGAFLLIHPYQVAAADRLRDYYFINSLGNPLDNSIAGASLAFGGVLERLPDLKVGIVHGGGFLPYQRGRLARMTEVRPETGEKMRRPVRSSLERLYFDTLVFDGAALEYLVRAWGADHVLMGTDYPFLMSDPRPVEAVNGLSGCSKSEIDLIRGANAARLLNLNL